MRFRLGNTRWRGLRLQFTASWPEVYRASWPVFALALVWLAVFFGLQALAPAPLEGAAAGRKLPQVSAPMVALVVLGLVLTVLCLIRIDFNYRSLLVLRASLGTELGRWKPVYMDFVRLWLATVGVFLASILVLSLLLAGLVGGSFAMVKALGQGQPGVGMVLFLIAAFVALLFLLFLATAPARAYREAALFRLTWNNIGVSRIARFKCDLRVGRYVLLRLRNMLLTLVTLGLFRPFAVVSEYRMKLESVTLHIKGGVDQVAGTLARQQTGGIGDALADAAGLELIV